MVSITSLQGAPNEVSLLDTSCICDGQALNCLAYVQSCSVKSSKIGQSFVTFYLKDKNANIIAARLFGVSDESAQKAQAFARRPVQIKGEVQVFNGSYSILLDGDIGITIYTGDFDYSSFIGSFDVDLSSVAVTYEKFMGKPLDVSLYKNLSVDFLGNGKVGAFAKIFDIAFTNLLTYIDVQGVDGKDLITTYFLVMQEYYLILVKYNKFGSLERLFLFKEYNSIHCDENYLYVVIDTLKSICENTKPLHLYAHLISMAVIQANKNLQLISANTSLVAGANMQVHMTDLLGGNVSGGVELLKY